jgi:ubiquinone biosynthesis monooxygenase Coq7
MATARKRGPRPALPGTAASPAGTEADVSAMIRVDHAGEFGALRIYQGQLAVLGRDPRARDNADAIRRMQAQEQRHFDVFDRMVKERAVRPTVLEPVWHVAGYALGAATALLGEKAAMACTVAVEDAIDAHYSAQLARLESANEPELKETVESFRADELAHRSEALARGAEAAPAYPYLSAAIRLGCRVAIRLSERL